MLKKLPFFSFILISFLNSSLFAGGGKYEDLSAEEGARHGVARYCSVKQNTKSDGTIQFIKGYRGRIAITAEHVVRNQLETSSLDRRQGVQIGTTILYPIGILPFPKLSEYTHDLALLFFDPWIERAGLADTFFPSLLSPTSNPEKSFVGTVIGLGAHIRHVFSPSKNAITLNHPLKDWGRKSTYTVASDHYGIELISTYHLPSRFTQPNFSFAYSGDSGAALIDENGLLRGILTCGDFFIRRTDGISIEETEFRTVFEQNMNALITGNLSEWSLPDHIRFSCETIFEEINSYKSLWIIKSFSQWLCLQENLMPFIFQQFNIPSGTMLFTEDDKRNGLMESTALLLISYDEMVFNNLFYLIAYTPESMKDFIDYWIFRTNFYAETRNISLTSELKLNAIHIMIDALKFMTNSPDLLPTIFTRLQDLFSNDNLPPLSREDLLSFFPSDEIILSHKKDKIKN